MAIPLPRLELSKISPFFAGDSDVSLTGVLLCYFAASKVLWDALLIITRNFLEFIGLVFICTSKYKFLLLDCLSEATLLLQPIISVNNREVVKNDAMC